MGFERWCTEIAGQAATLAGTVEGAGLGTPVPSCPGWNVAQLLRHLSGGLRWAEEIARTRAAGPLPQMLDLHPEQRELFGPGRTIPLHATDASGASGAEWVVDLTGTAITWRRAHEKAAVAVRGPLTELLLLVYGRRPVTDRVEVLGDRELLDFWRARTGFG